MFAALIAVFANFFFLILDPVETRDWILAATTDFLPLSALAMHIFLGIAAAFRTSPTRIDPDASYRSQVMRDAALAAAIVALMAGAVNFASTGLQATVFSESIRNFASEAAPRIAGYIEEVGEDLSDPPPIPSAEQVEQGLQPPTLSSLGSSLGNTALATMALGALGGVIGALRGRSNPDPPEEKPDE
ncbi:MAG: hypothetical protein H0U65_12815 [Rubrobacter sp.]|nr:hypothetical protein [Rubrobacter sp.]